MSLEQLKKEAEDITINLPIPPSFTEHIRSGYNKVIERAYELGRQHSTCVNEEKLKEHIEKNYKPQNGAITEFMSEGNSTDVFNDGIECGKAIALYDIACALNIEVEQLAQPDLEQYD